ncbi:hypothetical protein [Halomicronema sp. CCY15110]|uniref:hypothetical protein n=1 Tax=Halomicronema sp. CCY15110 TaxID=2767773 RepID=UPI00194EDBC8|nr:hypothetical protein [Halomicronema sp. CCY15110]
MKLNKYLSYLGLVVTIWVGGLGWVNLDLVAGADQGGSIAGQDVELDYEAALTELQTSFTFQGEPTNPRAVTAMLPWLSDRLPGAIAIDIEGSTADTNQFYADVFVDEAGRATAVWEQFGEERFASYQNIGQLSDGTQVLKVFVNTGGNAVFPYVMLANFGLDAEIAWDGDLRPRLTMRRRDASVVGVGYTDEITISGQALTFTPGLRGETFMTTAMTAMP